MYGILSLFGEYFMSRAKESSAKEIADEEFVPSDLWFYGSKLGLVCYCYVITRLPFYSSSFLLLL